jgi:UDP-N-acetyl-D-mannosaminuronic acid dehydrogenase
MARAVNDAMPEHVLAQLRHLAAPPARLALLGLTYKADVDDIRESPALRVAELAVAAGFDVRVCDPHVASPASPLVAPLRSLEQAVRDAEVVALLVDHAAFKDLDVDLVAALVSKKQLFDARDALDHAAWRARGFRVVVLGAGNDALMSSPIPTPTPTSSV